jgi:outer membrane protein assembly factor BamB
VRRAATTISCRAFALAALLIAIVAGRVAAADRPPPPRLPLAQWWSVPLDGPVSAGPVSDGTRIYLAYAAGVLQARDARDGRELWRQNKDVSLPMTVEGDLLILAGGDAIEALHADTGRSAWLLPRTKTSAPLLARTGWLLAITDTEVIAIHAATGEVAWRHDAGGITLSASLDAGRVYTGATDGRVLALSMADGSEVWDRFFDGGITAIAAYGGRVYVGTGDKWFRSLDGRKGDERPPFRLGALAVGQVAVDDDRVYVASLDNVVRALDRDNGNQRWHAGLSQRSSLGVFVSGHIVFVPTGANQLQMLWDRNGDKAGALPLPGEMAPHLPPAIVDSVEGPAVFVVTGGLTNEWNLTKFAPAGEAALVPLADLTALPGPPFLTDPELQPTAKILLRLQLIGDPPAQPFDAIEWPVVLKDPLLVPLTTLPGLQLRALSPVLPVRRAARGPGG